MPLPCMPDKVRWNLGLMQESRFGHQDGVNRLRMIFQLVRPLATLQVIATVRFHDFQMISSSC